MYKLKGKITAIKKIPGLRPCPLKFGITTNATLCWLERRRSRLLVMTHFQQKKADILARSARSDFVLGFVYNTF